MPDNTDEITSIPLGLKLNRPGEIIFRIHDIDQSLSEKRIFLTDLVTGINQDLIPDKAYTINLGTGEYNNRFILNLSNITTKVPEIPERLIYSLFIVLMGFSEPL